MPLNEFKHKGGGWAWPEDEKIVRSILGKLVVSYTKLIDDKHTPHAVFIGAKHTPYAVLDRLRRLYIIPPIRG
jgi:hypothetical protein